MIFTFSYLFFLISIYEPNELLLTFETEEMDDWQEDECLFEYTMNGSK